MSPTLVHRYAFPIRDAVEALLGDAVGDCEAWRIRVEGDEVVVDVIAPTPGIAPTISEVTSLANERLKRAGIDWFQIEDGSPHDRYVEQASNEADELVRGKSREEPHKHGPDIEPDFPADEQSGETSLEPAVSRKEPDADLKGGPLAQRAAISCAERGFWTFLGVASGEEAKADVCRRCGVTSRRLLDHDERAAAVWNDIDGKYRLWLEGHDVELDPVNDGDIGHE